MLTAGLDYLFFAKVDCTHQSLITTVTRGAAVLTPNLIAVVPHVSEGEESQLTTHEGDTLQLVQELLLDPTLELDAFEKVLDSMLRGTFTRWAFPLAELETFKVKTGFFGTITLKPRRDAVRRIIIRDKGGKAAAKAFYADRLLARATAAAS